MSAEPKNEEAVCALVKRFIEHERNETLAVEKQPDKVDRSRQAVELVLASATARFVVEHTRIESFSGQIKDGQQFVALLEPLESELTGRLPEGKYDLIVDVGACGAVNRTKSDEVRTALREWVVNTAPTLAQHPDRDHRDLKWSTTATPRGVPFPVTLQRWHRLGPMQPGESRLLIMRHTPKGDRESLRSQRINTALAKKLPKLEAAKAEYKAESVLALESDDIALANAFVIRDAVRKELNEYANAPDTIYLVETDRGLALRLWVLKEAGRATADEEFGPVDVGPPKPEEHSSGSSES